MLQWLWEYGDRCEIARSIPQLDPRRMRTLVEGSDGPNNGDKIDTSWKKSHSEDDDDLSIGAARRALVIGDIGEGMYKMLLAFHIFEPFVHWDKAFICHADVGHERWHISFLVRSLVPVLAAGIIAKHVLRSLHSAAFVYSLVILRVLFISTPSTSSSNHCR